MREAGSRGCRHGRKRHTTRRDKYAVPAPDLVSRNFAATSSDRLSAADITYVGTQEGFVYLSFILDVYSRKAVGWSMSDHPRTELVVDALEIVLWRRKPSAGLIITLIGGCNTPRFRSASGSKKQVLCPLWDGGGLCSG